MDKSLSNLSLKAGWISILINLLLFVIKYWVGVISGSVALIADAWHTLSDSLSSIFVIFGIWLSQKPADKNHPFGHGRYELVFTILIGCLLAFVAYNFLIESIVRLQNRSSAVFGTLAIVVTVISIVGKEALAQYSFYIGRKTGSGAVSADGWHHRSDALSSLIILIGIFLGRYFWWIDGVLGIIVALMILYTAIMIMKNTSNSLLGEKPELELINRIRDICQKKVGYEIHPHHVHLHNYINHKELTLHIYLPDQMTITMAHEISSSIEKEIEQLLQIETTIHVEPLSILPFDNDKNE